MSARVIVSGDAQGGWLVDIHDGDNHGVYSPAVETEAEAREAALHAHGERFASVEAAAAALKAAQDARDTDA